MLKGDLVMIADKFGINHFGLITDTIIMDEVLFIVTFFDGSEIVVHPARIKVIPSDPN